MKFADNIAAWFERMLPNLIAALVIFVVGVLINKIVMKIMSKAMDIRKVNTTVHKFLMSIVKVVIYIFVFITMLSMLGVPMSSMVAAVGTAGLTLGLALQDSLSNIAGGFMIMFTKPFKCGDYIRIGSSEGFVDQISLVYTRLLTVGNEAIYLPNKQVTSSTINNITDEKTRRMELFFSISYNSDHDRAMGLIRTAVKEDSRFLPEEPMVVIYQHGENAIVIMMRAWVATKDYWDARFALLKRIKEDFDQNGIVIPFNQLDVHMDSRQAL